MTQAAPTSTYFRHLAEGRFMLQHSPSTDEWVYYPRMVAPKTGATDMVWEQPSGLGTVYATTVKRVKPPAADVNIAIVELDEVHHLARHQVRHALTHPGVTVMALVPNARGAEAALRAGAHL